MNIERIDSEITYEDFYNQFLLKNRPCIFSSFFTKTWLCRRTWIKENKLDISIMRKFFENAEVPVVDCNTRFHSSHCKADMLMDKFLNYWAKRDDNRILYLKDWHCQRNFSSLNIYKVPEYFQSDWLNEYWDERDDSNDDYRFVYIGVKNSWTPFHADVFYSYSWSANICGLKKWLIFPPGSEEQLKDSFGNLPYDVDEYIKKSNIFVKPIIVYQKEGEIIFIPSGWYHQVHNVEDTVSINHNWINASSIVNMYQYICSELEKVKHEIHDCIDMDGFLQQCQVILNASIGIDFKTFLEMLILLGTRRLNILKNANDKNYFNEAVKSIFISSTPGIHSSVPFCGDEKLKEFIKIDLRKIREVLLLLLHHSDTSEVICKDLLTNAQNLCSELNQICF